MDNRLKHKRNYQLTDKQFNWAEEVIEGMKDNTLNMRRITENTYNTSSAKSTSVIQSHNARKEKITKYISERLKELELFKDIGRNEVENWLKEVIFTSKGKTADKLHATEVLGKYKGYTRPDIQQNTLNLYNIKEKDLKDVGDDTNIEPDME